MLAGYLEACVIAVVAYEGFSENKRKREEVRPPLLIDLTDSLDFSMRRLWYSSFGNYYKE